MMEQEDERSQVRFVRQGQQYVARFHQDQPFGTYFAVAVMIGMPEKPIGGYFYHIGIPQPDFEMLNRDPFWSKDTFLSYIRKMVEFISQDIVVEESIKPTFLADTGTAVFLIDPKDFKNYERLTVKPPRARG